jgi:hypothetical protein
LQIKTVYFGVFSYNLVCTNLITLKNLVAAVVLFVSGLLLTNAQAQLKITPSDVREITVNTVVAGLLGNMSTFVKVVPVGGVWRSYIVHKARTLYSSDNINYDSTLNRLITEVDPLLVNRFLQGITVIKPRRTRETFGLTPNGLIAGLRRDAKSTLTDTDILDSVITQSIIDSTITSTVTNPIVLDAFEGCTLSIITKSSDTTKINTRVYCPTKLPWTINNKQTYDMSINNFVVAIMGQEDVVSKYNLSINSLIERIYHNIDRRYKNMPITTFKWKHNNPETVKRLTDQFNAEPYWAYGDTFDVYLTTSAMFASTRIGATIDMTRSEDIERLIAYGKLVDQYLTKSNFMFNYYRKKNKARISFRYKDGWVPNIPTNNLSVMVPGLSNADLAKTVTCSVDLPDDYSDWMLFPDGRLLLFRHQLSTPDTAPFYLKKTSGSSRQSSYSYILYNREGKILTP